MVLVVNAATAKIARIKEAAATTPNLIAVATK